MRIASWLVLAGCWSSTPAPATQSTTPVTVTPAPRDNLPRVDPDDPDGDGIASRDDKCPNDAEDLDRFQDDDGCPDPDNDQDGFPDADDKCPDVPETYSPRMIKDGCPD